ncbi:DNA polymerase beta superfamily protein [Nonomuraea purpurea]|uniref:DNA polymerase beta superfamily protein n=1 Tax=Nonomuraea purpurea TaxID=1849276 RepID=A0ABV8G4M3_9ACTN
MNDDLILSVVMGSRAYGLETDDSDTDRRGVYAAPTAAFWRLDKPPTHRDGPLPEQFSWEVERFCVLALDANPTVLECLWSPIVEVITPAGRRLRELRTAFVSEKVRHSFAGYSDAQLRRLDPAAPAWKRTMHMLRLLLSALHLVRHGEPLIQVGPHRERLLAIKRGEVPWAEVDAWRQSLSAELAATRCTLPERPDRRRVEDFLASVRRENL